MWRRPCPAVACNGGRPTPRTRRPVRVSTRHRARNVTEPRERERRELRRCGDPSRTTSPPACRVSVPPPNSSGTTCPSLHLARCPIARRSMSPRTSTDILALTFGGRRTIGHAAIHHRMSRIQRGHTTEEALCTGVDFLVVWPPRRPLESQG